MKIKFAHSLMGVAFILTSLTAHAGNITYDVNQTIGAGSVVGTIETDGTLGALQSPNIVNWSLTITAPNLGGGSPDTITDTAALQSTIVGDAFSATLNDLKFNFSATTASYFAFQGLDGNNWCGMTAGGISCAFEPDPAQEIGFASGTHSYAQYVTETGNVVIASVHNVPEPATLALMGLGIVGLGLSRRKSKSWY